MMKSTRVPVDLRKWTYVLSGVGAALVSGGTVRVAQAADSAEDASVLQEIVVTATKQTDTLNRVPLSVAAVTQAAIDEQGLKTFADLARTVPALSLISATGVDRTPSISIRGIYSNTGAQTTGVYLDDTPLQKRTPLSNITGGGTPLPELFDLERVEVLRGPQGTLFGGSAEGGAVRFITPTPSLSQYSAYTRVEGSYTQDGDPNYEGGLAVGGPIVNGVIGFRASVFGRVQGGYTDHIDRYTGATLASNTNSSNASSARLAFLIAPLENLTITPAVYFSRSRSYDADTFWENIPQYTAPSLTIGPHTYPSYTYGPYNVYGAYKSGVNCNIGANYANVIAPCAELQPKESRLLLPSLSVEYDWSAVTVKAIASYVDDQTFGHGSYSYLTNTSPATGGGPFNASVPQFFSPVNYGNARHGLTGELRFSSPAGAQPLSWVGGFFYSEFNEHSTYVAQGNLDDFSAVVFGLPTSAIFGVPLEPGNVIQHRDQHLQDKEAALFGELDYFVTSRLKLIGGVRVSRTEFKYSQIAAGTLSGFLVPTFANGGLTEGDVVEHPVTPRAGVQYLLDDHNSLYATAAKGFRAGGVNQPPPGARCAQDLQSLGLTSTPATYDSDSLWSYEIGAKLRPLERLQLNASAFYITWSNVQASYALPTCGFGYTINGAKAVSKGFDLQTEVLLLKGLTLSAQASYTNARYTAAVQGPAPSYTLFINKDDPMPTPQWSSAVSLQYSWAIFTGQKAYARIDYQYTGPHVQGFGPLTSSYNPDVYRLPHTDFVTTRAGVKLDAWDVSIFAQNLFDSQTVLSRSGGRSGCLPAGGAGCTVYRQTMPVYQDTTFRPRTVGVTVAYSF